MFNLKNTVLWKTGKSTKNKYSEFYLANYICWIVNPFKLYLENFIDYSIGFIINGVYWIIYVKQP